ncbi:hypothetical protein SVAN01_00281 [Stagonosporopsis vannaccii]|nr:hypothetical protein SVAN01_00281 [Stagonosporopsis vannaccii]
MTGEKRSSDLSSRLSVKRGGKLISKTLSKSSSPPSISAPPRAAVGASKVKKDEVQRRKNSFHDMFKGSTKDKESGQGPLLSVPVTGAVLSSASHGSRGNVASRADNPSLTHETLPETGSDKAAELEIALVTAREETAAVRQELERVKQDAQASVEISKHQAAEAHRQATPESAIQMPYSHHGNEDDMNDREELLVQQNNKLRSRLKELEDQLIAQPTFQPSEALHSEEDWNALTLRLHEVEKESYSRLQQLLSLKSSISSLTRADSQVSDNELADSFSQLANRVREWVVSNYRRTKLRFDNLPETTVQILQSIKVNYWETDSVDKLALYQAIVSRMLIRIFEEPLVIGMPEQDVFVGLRTFLKGAQHAGAEFWEWKRTTFRLIERVAPASTIDEWKTQSLERLAFELEAIMYSISFTVITATARSALMGIMTSTANLQRTLSLQKATYSVVFFDTFHESHGRFDNRAMEPVDDFDCSLEEDGEPVKERKFVFCIFPCLEKVEHGSANVVFKARVCCGVG